MLSASCRPSLSRDVVKLAGPEGAVDFQLIQAAMRAESRLRLEGDLCLHAA